MIGYWWDERVAGLPTPLLPRSLLALVYYSTPGWRGEGEPRVWTRSLDVVHCLRACCAVFVRYRGYCRPRLWLAWLFRVVVNSNSSSLAGVGCSEERIVASLASIEHLVDALSDVTVTHHHKDRNTRLKEAS